VKAVALVVASCAAPAPHTARDFAQQLAGASATADAAAVRALLLDTVADGGLWFDDATCAQTFGAPRALAATEVDAFAACLAKLGLRVSARIDALPDVAVLEYAPGFELEARFVDDASGPRISWIGYSSRLADDTLPTVAAAALEPLRVAGDRDGPLDPARVGPSPVRHAWLKVCVDDTGTVAAVDVRETTSPRIANMVASAAVAWRFKPFVVGGKPTPVCALFYATYPPQVGVRASERLPLPMTMTSGRPVVPPTELEQIAGERVIVPDPGTRAGARKAAMRFLVGTFKFCVDASGHVDEVAVMRSSRSLAYDQRVVRTLKTWAFRPFVIDGAPAPVCSAITFAYRLG
jgi:TonB family protein